jgi:hypothetical protein
MRSCERGRLELSKLVPQTHAPPSVSARDPEVYQQRK